jgi:hypothetical protein
MLHFFSHTCNKTSPAVKLCSLQNTPDGAFIAEKQKYALNDRQTQPAASNKRTSAQFLLTLLHHKPLSIFFPQEKQTCGKKISFNILQTDCISFSLSNC